MSHAGSLVKSHPGKTRIFGQFKSGNGRFLTLIRNSLPPDARTLLEPSGFIPEDLDDRRRVLARTILKQPGHPEPEDYVSVLGFDRRLCIARDPHDWLVSATLFTCQLKEAIFADEKAMAWVVRPRS